MNYSIDLKKNFSIDLEADNFKDAINKAKLLHPEFDVDFVYNNDTDEGTGNNACEGCGEFITDDEVFGSDDENGGYYCKGCIGAIKEDMEKYPEEYLTDDE